MRGHEYDKSMRHFWLGEECTSARDVLHYVVQSMSAVAWMTRCTLLVDNTGEGIPAEMAEGLCHLLDQQCAMLNGVHEELGKEEDARKDERAAVGDFDQSRAPTEALLEPARKLRLQFIEASANAGAEHRDIARALNIDEADIARVVGQLRGEPASRTKAARAARTANAR